MYKKERNEKKLIWHDIKLSTVYGKLKNDVGTGDQHTHSSYELFIIKSANGYIQTDIKRIKFSKNMLIIIPPHTKHSLYLHPNSNTCAITIRFDYKKINDSRRKDNEPLFFLFDNTMPAQNQFLILKDKYYGQFYDRFFSENESVPLLASSLIKHMIEGLFLKVLRCAQNMSGSKEEIPIYSYTTVALSTDAIVANTIDDYIAKPGCTLEALSEQLKMSPRNVQRIFKKMYNKSFTERLTEVRLSKAITLMKTTDFPLSKIAELCNYNKYDSFRKAFILTYEVTPTQYREAYKVTKKECKNLQ